MIVPLLGTPKNDLWNQEPDVLGDPVLERSHQEKMIQVKFRRVCVQLFFSL
jgi:hypothetical protein